MQFHLWAISNAEFHMEEDSENNSRLLNQVDQHSPALNKVLVLISDIRRQSIWAERNVEKPLGAHW